MNAGAEVATDAENAFSDMKLKCKNAAQKTECGEAKSIGIDSTKSVTGSEGGAVRKY